MPDTLAEFSIDGWHVDPARGRLLERDSRRVVPVRPKSMAVLQALAAAGGRVVSRESLLASVWPETLASDESLNRCITDLRQALGDDGRNPRYIETVPKRGYRLIPAVQPVDGDAPARPAGSAKVAGQRTGGRGLPRWLWPGAAALLLLVALLQWRVEDSPDVPPTLAILPAVKLPESGSGGELLGIAAVDLLFQRLSEIPDLQLRGPASLADAADPLSAAAVLGAGHALEVRNTGPMAGQKLQTAVWLHDLSGDTGPSTLIGRFDLPLLDSETDIGTFLEVRERIATRVVERLLPALDIRPGVSAPPADPAAYRLYLQARDRLGRPGCEGRAPNVLLERSLERDPDYVPAWVALGWANYGLASTCGLGPAHYDAALEAADQALERAPDTLPAVALKATVQVETGAAGPALEMIDRYLGRFPGSAALHYTASYAAYYVGDLARSERALSTTLALDDLYLTAEGWTPNVLLYRQRYAGFLDLLPATRSTLFDFYRGYALVRLGDRAGARSLLAEGYATNPTDVFGRLSGALLAVLDGAPETALAIIDALAYERRTHGVADGEVAFRLAQLAALAGDPERALEQLATAGELGFRCPACIDSDPLLRDLAAGNVNGSSSAG